MTAPPARGLAREHILTLLPQRHPDPEPADELDERKGEEDAVLEPVAAPARGAVARRRRRVREAVPRGGGGGGGGGGVRGGAEEHGVADEGEGAGDSEGRWGGHKSAAGSFWRGKGGLSSKGMSKKIRKKQGS